MERHLDDRDGRNRNLEDLFRVAEIPVIGFERTEGLEEGELTIVAELVEVLA